MPGARQRCLIGRDATADKTPLSARRVRPGAGVSAGRWLASLALPGLIAFSRNGGGVPETRVNTTRDYVRTHSRRVA